jgi:hypothetical protein
LQQSGQQGESFDRGLGLMASAFGTAQQQHDLLNYAQNIHEPNQADMIGNIMKLQQMQQAQQEHNRFMAGAATLAPILNMTPEQATMAANAGVLPQIMETHFASLAPKNLDERQYLQAQQAAAAMGQPFPDFATWTAQHQTAAAVQKTQGENLLEAQNNFGAQTAKQNEIERITNDIQNATNPDGTPVMQSILSDPRKKAAAMGLINASGDTGAIGSYLQQGSQWLAALTPQEQAAIANLKQLSSSQYATAFTSTGSRRTQQEVQNIAASLSQLSNLNQPYSSYMDAFNNLHKLNQTGMANAYGAAQRLDEVPDNLKPLVNPIYLPAQTDEKGNQIRPKGSLYSGFGGDWATKPLPTTAAPTQQAPAPAPQADVTQNQLRPLGNSDQARVRAAIAANPRDRAAIIARVQANGFSTGGL